MFSLSEGQARALAVMFFCGLGAVAGHALAGLLWLFGVPVEVLVGVTSVATVGGALAGLWAG